MPRTGTARSLDWTDHGLIELAGADRVKFLHSFCTNDIKRLIAGSGCEAFVTNVKGRILGHLWIEAGDTALRLDAGPVATERLLAHLERYIINEDVVVTDRSSDLGELLVIGPRAAESLVPLSADVRRLAPLQHLDVAGPSGEIRVSRRDVDDLPAYVVCGPHGVLGEAWEKIKEAGARPAGATIWSGVSHRGGAADLGRRSDRREPGTRSGSKRERDSHLPRAAISGRNRLPGSTQWDTLTASCAACGSPARRSRRPVPVSFPMPEVATAVGAITSAAMSYGSASPVALGPDSFQRVGTGEPGLRGSRPDARPGDRFLGSRHRAGNVSPPSKRV